MKDIIKYNSTRGKDTCLSFEEVISAAATKPFGFQAFLPGPGVGGHCIPIDPYYLSWKAKELGLEMKLIDVAGEINASMPNLVVKKVENIFKIKLISIKTSKVLILGLTYKKNIDDIRESPSLKIINLLKNKGVNISYNDPFVSKKLKNQLMLEGIQSTELSSSNIKVFDCVILLTDHDIFNYEMIKENSKLLVDTRGKYKKSLNIFKA